MVLLSRIYTRTGDDGTTALGDGRRIRKDAPRIEACGTVDELNSVLGLAVTAGLDGEAADILQRVQNDLFDLGADLSVPEKSPRGKGARKRPPLRIVSSQIRRLEEAIDRANARLASLRSFVLPGGSASSAWLHLARTLCRRAERTVVALSRKDRVNPHVQIYLNRLSDLLFVLARRANDDGRNDVLWIPGASR
jgi:cob(I)alamin adenosyltransferase